MQIKITNLFKLKEESWSSTAYSSKNDLLVAVDRAGYVYCFNLQQNQLVWRKKLGPMITASPILEDVNGDGNEEILIGVEQTGRFLCLDIEGNILWERVCGSSIRSNAQTFYSEKLNATCVIVAGYGNHMFCLDGKTGQVLWKTFLGKHIFSGALGVVSSPLIADVDGDGKNEIVIGSRHRMVVCLDSESGKIKWNYMIYSDPDSSPSIAWIDKTPYIFVGGGEFTNGLGDLSVHAINGITGKRIWKKKLNGGLDSCPVVRDIDNDGNLEVVITSLADFSCYALDAITGEVKWKTPFNKTHECIGNNEICFTKEKYFTEDAICRSYTTPLIFEDNKGVSKILVGSNNGQIMMLNGFNGNIIESNNTNGMVRASFIGIAKNKESYVLAISGKNIIKINLPDVKSVMRNQFSTSDNSFNILPPKVFNTRNLKFKTFLKFYFHLLIVDFFRWGFNVLDLRFKFPIKLLVKNRKHNINL